LEFAIMSLRPSDRLATVGEIRLSLAAEGKFSLFARRGACRSEGFSTVGPKHADMSRGESWRKLPGGSAEFTMRRLETVD
jgi:hypothetical protein